MSEMVVFGSQDLSNTAWAFATFALLHRPLLDAIATAASDATLDFNASHLTMTAWSW